MKKLVWTVILVGVALFILDRAQIVVDRSYSVVNREAAMATVNGGDGEFAAQEAVKAGGQSLGLIFRLANLAVIGLGLLSGIVAVKKMVKKGAKKRSLV